jgi:uncharacterized protein (TIGR00297 family)
MFTLSTRLPSFSTEKFVHSQKQQKLFRFLLGLFFSSTVGLLAYRRRSLSRSGVAGAIVTGTSTVGLGGWSWGLTLIFFFVSSSFFSHFRAREKEVTAEDKFSKGSQRDLLQVMANGGVATTLALGYACTSKRTQQNTLRAGYVGALATATADTWATELGVLSPQLPRLITTGKQTTPGTSGGITLLGTASSAAGSLALGTFFWLIQRKHKENVVLPFIALISGLFGSLFDSFLGATVQAMYFCPVCHKETERQVHNCGNKTQYLRGLPLLNNDVVNFLSTLFGAITAMLLAILNQWQ